MSPCSHRWVGYPLETPPVWMCSNCQEVRTSQPAPERVAPAPDAQEPIGWYCTSPACNWSGKTPDRREGYERCPTCSGNVQAGKVWCLTCESWRHTQPCGRDECPIQEPASAQPSGAGERDAATVAVACGCPAKSGEPCPLSETECAGRIERYLVGRAAGRAERDRTHDEMRLWQRQAERMKDERDSAQAQIAALTAEREDLSEKLTEQHVVVREMRAAMDAISAREGALRKVAYEFYMRGKGHNAPWPIEQRMRAALGMESDAEPASTPAADTPTPKEDA